MTMNGQETAQGRAYSSSIRTNVVLNLIRTLTLTILSFMTYPYVTRALGDSVLGTYTWAASFVYYFAILAKISIPTIAIRECVKVISDKKAFSSKVQQFFILEAIMAVLSFGILCAFVFSVPSLFSEREVIFILSINFLSQVFTFSWVYSALDKHFYIAFRSIVALAISAILVFVFIHPTSTARTELNIYAIITVSSSIITAIMDCIILPKYVSFRKTGPCDFASLAKPLLILFAISMVVALYDKTDVLILGFLDKGKASVGSYSVGVKGIDIVIGLITSLGGVFMPRATFYYQQEDKRFFRNLLAYSSNITFFIAIPAITTMAAMAPSITKLISGNNGYVGAPYILMILVSMILTYCLADSIYTQILIPEKKESTYLWIMGLGVILNVTLSLILGLLAFKGNPVIGVAIATMASDLLILVALLIITWNYSSKAVFNMNNLKIVLVGLLIGVASYFLQPAIKGLMPYPEDWRRELVALSLTVLLDAAIYAGGLYLLKEKIMRGLISKRKGEDNDVG